MAYHCLKTEFISIYIHLLPPSAINDIHISDIHLQLF